jgi:hypothetical protein
MFTPGYAHFPDHAVAGCSDPRKRAGGGGRDVAIKPTAAIVRADFPRKIGPYSSWPARPTVDPEDLC